MQELSEWSEIQMTEAHQFEGEPRARIKLARFLQKKLMIAKGARCLALLTSTGYVWFLA